MAKIISEGSDFGYAIIYAHGRSFRWRGDINDSGISKNARLPSQREQRDDEDYSVDEIKMVKLDIWKIGLLESLLQHSWFAFSV